MKGKKLWLEQRFMGSRTGRCTLAGAAGEAEACEKLNGEVEARMRSQVMQVALAALP